MKRLTGYDEKGNVFSCEEERLLNASGLISKDDMYKIMMHLAEKLAKYEDLEEQGRLLKLPCAVGDTVHTLNPLPSGKTVISETTADAFFCALCTLEGRFGKTVFATREEAESALKELQMPEGN